MRRMIPNKLIDWIKSLVDIVRSNGTKVEFGGAIDVDGNVQVNSVANLTDKEGNPLAFGGGTKLYKHTFLCDFGGVNGYLVLINNSAIPIENNATEIKNACKNCVNFYEIDPSNQYYYLVEYSTNEIFVGTSGSPVPFSAFESISSDVVTEL